MPLSETYNEDCIAGMKRYPDKYFDLAVVDPVFGEMVTQGGYMSNSSSSMAKNKNYHNTIWQQEKTGIDYFKELFRVSKNQIIWGGNYFTEEINKNSSCWIVWNKKNGENHFADCEIAWTSFETAVRMFEFRWQGMLQENMKDKENRIHPTQKPVALYEWIFHNYARQSIRCGQKHTKEYDYLCNVCSQPFKILDTHLGSQSSRIAAHKGGFDFVGFEIDPDYFRDGNKRFAQYLSQTRLEFPK
jgi:site-specific DNA-methyltransferase (adenine-specific)